MTITGTAGLKAGECSRRVAALVGCKKAFAGKSYIRRLRQIGKVGVEQIKAVFAHKLQFRKMLTRVPVAATPLQ